MSLDSIAAFMIFGITCDNTVYTPCLCAAVPNEFMKNIHNRMPVVLQRQDVEEYLNDGEMAQGIIKRVPPELVREAV